MLNLNSVEGGDTHLQPLNMVPLGTEPSDDAGTTIDNRVRQIVADIMEQANKEGTV